EVIHGSFGPRVAVLSSRAQPTIDVPTIGVMPVGWRIHATHTQNATSTNVDATSIKEATDALGLFLGWALVVHDGANDHRGDEDEPEHEKEAAHSWILEVDGRSRYRGGSLLGKPTHGRCTSGRACADSLSHDDLSEQRYLTRGGCIPAELLSVGSRGVTV